MKIRLTGYITVPPDRLEAIIAALPEHIRLSRAEAGCESFSVTPTPQHQGRFDVAEVFANRAAFDLHQTRSKTSTWGRICQGLPRSYQIDEISG